MTYIEFPTVKSCKWFLWFYYPGGDAILHFETYFEAMAMFDGLLASWVDSKAKVGISATTIHTDDVREFRNPLVTKNGLERFFVSTELKPYAAVPERYHIEVKEYHDKYGYHPQLGEFNSHPWKTPPMAEYLPHPEN